MGVLLEALYFRNQSPVPSPVDGDPQVPFWWDHIASQANALRKAGFTAVWLPPPLKGASGGFSSGYDPFDDYDLGSKNQMGIVTTRFGGREKLQRCAALLRANGLDVYVDVVDHHRDGDQEPFIFRYVNSSGEAAKGRFPKNPHDFHPIVPNDPNTFDNSDSFGRRLAVINGVGTLGNLLEAGDWLTKALDLQGFRLDDVKGTSANFTLAFLTHGAMAGKYAVGEFFDTNFQTLGAWQNLVQNKAAVFDFSLHFVLRQMCDFPDFFNMGDLDHAGYAGVNPLGAVTFVENHDTDQNVKGEGIMANKTLGYAYLLTSEGYPSVFYKDYSTDKGCYGLKPVIDPLIWVHEHLAAGPTQQRWKDPGVFAFERMGAPGLLAGLNKDANNSRTITVATAFGPNAELHDFTGSGHNVRTDHNGNATITIPRNANGRGYVCYSRNRAMTPFAVHAIETTQEFAGAADLDISPATTAGFTDICRVWVQAGKRIVGALFFDILAWTAQTSIELELHDPHGNTLASGTFKAGTAQGTKVNAHANHTGYYLFRIMANNTPAKNPNPGFHLRVTYTASQTLEPVEF